MKRDLNSASNDRWQQEVDETLRLLVQLPPPSDLTDRVHAGLRDRQAVERAISARRGFWGEVWSRWTPARRLQFAGAAVLVIAVGGSTWSASHLAGKEHERGAAKDGSPVAAPAVNSPSPESFGSAKAERVPPSLKPIKVPAAPKRKPSAGHVKRLTKAGNAPTDSPGVGATDEPKQ